MKHNDDFSQSIKNPYLKKQGKLINIQFDKDVLIQEKISTPNENPEKLG